MKKKVCVCLVRVGGVRGASHYFDSFVAFKDAKKGNDEARTEKLT